MEPVDGDGDDVQLDLAVVDQQFDVGAIDLLIQRIVDNTAEAVIKDGFEQGLEGLEELFGNPPPRLPTPPPGSAPAAPPAAGPPGLSFPAAPAG